MGSGIPCGPVAKVCAECEVARVALDEENKQRLGGGKTYIFTVCKFVFCISIIWD